MNQRAQALAQRFTTANAELIHYLDDCSEHDLDRVTTAEGWPVRVVAHHIALSHESLSTLVQLFADGQPLPPLTEEMIHAANAQHAVAYATVSQEATLDKLKHGVKHASAIISGLSDAALDRTSYFALFSAEITPEDVIEHLLILHLNGHLESIKAAVGK
ncbi:MAG: DinB family protein [Caldilineaceae bacterium]|nr:DinB family protein [Caldilineaceae bacterium]